MLRSSKIDNTIAAFRQYVKEVLQLTTDPVKWDGEETLPYYLRDLYAFYRTDILGIPHLLMVARDDGSHTPAEVRRHLVSVRELWGGEVIYVQAAISAYNRKRLIQQKVPFIVPGKQMFLASLGIDLREHFRRGTEHSARISPSTQAVVLYALLQDACREYTPSGLAETLGYTRMTMSRAFDELGAAELGTVEMHGRERKLRVADDKRACWERAREWLSSPVRKRVWVHLQSNEWQGVYSGLTALAHYSMLAPPDYPVFAVGLQEWKSVVQQYEVAILPQAEPDAVMVEIWSYDPRLFSADNVVDRLSLFLSLRADPSERVKSAIEEMMENAP